MKTLEDVFREMDPAGFALKDEAGYRRYKAELIKDGVSVADMEIQLRGFIWNATDAESAQEADAENEPNLRPGNT